jgi:ABC-type multidrug transport system ATPase subunit
MNRILKVDNLKIEFKNDLILNNISLSLNAGDVYALVGINGSGKTTLLSSLAGLLSPTSGNISIEEKLSNLTKRVCHSNPLLSTPI